MKLHIEWSRAISLKYSRSTDTFTVALQKVPKKAGLYIFGRKYGKSSRHSMLVERIEYGGASKDS